MFHTSEFWPLFTNEAIQNFLQAESGEPVPSSSINREAILTNSKKITSFLTDIQAVTAQDYACRQTYIDFENTRLAELNLILESANEVESLRLNDQIFGKPAQMHEDQALAYLSYSILTLRPASPLVADAHNLLLDTWREIKPSENIKDLFAVYDSLRVQLKPYVEERFAFLDGLLHEYDDMLTTEETASAVNAALDRMDCKTKGWSTSIRDGAPNAFIDYDKKNIVLPKGRPYSKSHLRGLIIHEIGVHVTRSINGGNSLEKLASVGLPGYGPAEEAMGTLLENAPREKFDLTHSLIVFAVIDFAARNHSFREIHELTKALLICLENKTDAQLFDHAPDYGRMAFSRCIRMMRLGTSTIVDRSMTKYWRGLSMLDEYFEKNGTTNGAIEKFLLGKYDCLNDEQLQLIKKH